MFVMDGERLKINLSFAPEEQKEGMDKAEERFPSSPLLQCCTAAIRP